MDDQSSTLTATEAADRLGVRRETLYAYVSRGLIRSEPGPDGRSSRYRRADIEAMLRRKALRRRPEAAAEGALNFGSPVLESRLTLLADGEIFYRGVDVRELAKTRCVEEVAAWLWLGDRGGSGEPAGVGELFEDRRALPASIEPLLEVGGAPWALETLQAVLPALGYSEPLAWAVRGADETARIGARILRSMVEVVTSAAPTHRRSSEWAEEGLAETLARGWVGHQGSPSETLDGAALLAACMVLCADHELNVSTFTARCVASAGSPLHSVIAAGLAALQGPRHGGHTRRVEAMFREAGSPDGVRSAFQDRLRRGEAIPGFGHRLHTGGDPRYLEVRRRLAAAPDAMAWIEAVEASGRDLLGQPPTIDVGLALVGRALALPRDAPITLFALGRTIGWIAHAIEQHEVGQLIRPRARYVGRMDASRDAG